jgi:ribosome-associated heat shock protein Hsp15
MRLDKWLWAARFFKTRSLAAEAIGGGKVDVNGERTKRAKDLKLGDEVRVRHGQFEHIVIVRGLSERRGPASEAATLYEETEASKRGRETLALQLRSLPTDFAEGRPTKKERRDIDRFRGRE